MKRLVSLDEGPSVLTDADRAELAGLQGRTPNTDDIPEAPAANWQNARRFYKVRKEPISIRLDADILDWLRNKAERYQPEINRILREAMETEVAR